MACIPDFIKKFSVVYRPLIVASVFKAEEDGCYFCACTCMCLIFLPIVLCTKLSKGTIQIEKLIDKIVIKQVISYWPSYRSPASCPPRANTADLGPVTGPIRNNLINNIIIV